MPALLLSCSLVVAESSLSVGGAELMRRQNGGAADPLQEKAKGAAVDVDFFRSFKDVWRPHDVDAEFLQIVEFPDNLTQVVDTVAIGIVGESHESRGKGAAIGFWRSLSELIG